MSTNGTTKLGVVEENLREFDECFPSNSKQQLVSRNKAEEEELRLNQTAASNAAQIREKNTKIMEKQQFGVPLQNVEVAEKKTYLKTRFEPAPGCSYLPGFASSMTSQPSFVQKTQSRYPPSSHYKRTPILYQSPNQQPVRYVCCSRKGPSTSGNSGVNCSTKPILKNGNIATGDNRVLTTQNRFAPTGINRPAQNLLSGKQLGQVILMRRLDGKLVRVRRIIKSQPEVRRVILAPPPQLGNYLKIRNARSEKTGSSDADQLANTEILDKQAKEEPIDVKEETIEVKEEPLDDYERHDNGQPIVVKPPRVIIPRFVFPVPGIPSSLPTLKTIQQTSLSRPSEREKTPTEYWKLFGSGVLHNRRPSPSPEIFLGAGKPINNLPNKTTSGFSKLTQKRIDSYYQNRLQSFTKKDGIVRNVPDSSNLLSNSALTEKEGHDTLDWTAAKRMEFSRQDQAKNDFNGQDVYKYMDSESFKQFLESPSMSTFEKMEFSSDLLGEIPRSSSLSLSNLFETPTKIHEDGYIAQNERNRIINEIKVRDSLSGPVRLPPDVEGASTSEQVLHNEQSHQINIVWNGSESKVPELVLCHLCDGIMRLCIRKTKYRGIVKEYPAYRCLRKGCQTFRSIKKQMDQNLNKGMSSTRRVTITFPKPISFANMEVKEEVMDDPNDFASSQFSRYDIRSEKGNQNEKRALESTEQLSSEGSSLYTLDAPPQKRIRKSILDTLSKDFQCGPETEEDHDEEGDEGLLGESIDFRHIYKSGNIESEQLKEEEEANDYYFEEEDYVDTKSRSLSPEVPIEKEIPEAMDHVIKEES
ncbi:hypothetical protein GCK72_001161 [Caenorhabditis remanei]|uniref:Uncharacterized protein n=1 Tax=Caenorhabditis remanei TaxID=31234 RepID=A0A6A5HRT1_CAERE|nr:hypothetical protein GCK72_001161 [Caenorhabditis remanei]KAF1769344.1 hypothetical protein GCK72_001161 [Caenorhabditis remanei]